MTNFNKNVHAMALSFAAKDPLDLLYGVFSSRFRPCHLELAVRLLKRDEPELGASRRFKKPLF
jgi:hypothetical protein